MGADRQAPLLTQEAPHVRDAMDVAGVMRWHVIALLPCVLAGAYGIGHQMRLASGAAGGDGLGCVLDGLLQALPLFLVSLAVVVGWEQLFARVRRRPVVPGALLVALLFTLALPVTMPWWKAAIALSFGVVLGKEIFGGTGRNIVHPAVAALTFLALAWPASMRGAVWVPVAEGARPWPYELAVGDGARALRDAGLTWWDLFVGGEPASLGAASPLAALLGAGVLVLRSLLPWRTVVAVFLGVVLCAGLFRGLAIGWGEAAWLPGYWHLVLGSVVFGTVFFATDPVTSPMTSGGRWIHGLLLGGVIVMIRVGNPSHPEGTFLALMLGSIFAPLNDAVVVWLHTRRRVHD